MCWGLGFGRVEGMADLSENIEVVKRGRVLCVVALGALGCFLAGVTISSAMGGIGGWTQAVIGLGALGAIGWRTYKGGTFALGLVKLILVIAGVMLGLMAAGRAALMASGGASAGEAESLWSWKAIVVSAGYVFVAWVFFVSKAARGFLERQREQAG